MIRLLLLTCQSIFLIFFFIATSPSAIYTLSLHDALPICRPSTGSRASYGLERPTDHDRPCPNSRRSRCHLRAECVDRKSTRLNSSHQIISYAVFCLKKKKRSKQTNS